jgi:hypothetical protein
MSAKLETDSVKLREIADRVEAFAEQHVVECCEEMLELQNTSILRVGGRIREMAEMLIPVTGGYSHLRVAESYVQRAAYRFVVQQGKKST